MHRTCVALALLLCAACPAPEFFIEHARPEARSAMLISVLEGGLSAEAFEADADGRVSTRHRPGTESYLVMFDAPLPAFGIQPGPVPAPRISCSSRFIPEASSALVVDESARRLVETILPTEVATLKYFAGSILTPAADLTPLVGRFNYRLQAQPDLTALLPWEDGLYLFDDTDGPPTPQLVYQDALGIVSADGLRSMYQHPGGLVLLGSASGRLYCGRWDEPFIELPFRAPNGLVKIAGRRESRELDAFAVSDSRCVGEDAEGNCVADEAGRLYQLSGTGDDCQVETSTVFFRVGNRENTGNGHIFLTDDGRIFAIIAGRDEAVEIQPDDDNRIIELPPETDAADAALDPDLGIVIVGERDVTPTIVVLPIDGRPPYRRKRTGGSHSQRKGTLTPFGTFVAGGSDGVTTETQIPAGPIVPETIESCVQTFPIVGDIRGFAQLKNGLLGHWIDERGLESATHTLVYLPFPVEN